MEKSLKSLVLSISVISLLACIGACDQGANNQTDATTNADSILTVDSLAIKIRNLTEQIKISPRNYILYTDRSKMYYDYGDTRSAISDIETSIRIFPEDPENYYYRGFYAYVSNQDDSAVYFLNKAVELKSLNPETYYLMGSLFYLKGKYKEAEHWITDAIKLDPEDPTYYFSKGLAVQKQNRTNEAIELYTESLKKDSFFIKSLTQLFEIYKNEKKDMAKAMYLNNRILRKDSLHPLGRFNLGNYYQELAFKTGLSSSDLKNAGKNKKISPGDSLMYLALHNYTLALVKDRTYLQALYNRGYGYYSLGKYEDALKDFNKVLTINKADEKAHFMVGSIYEFYGDKTVALQHFKMALEAKPDFKEAEQAIKELEK